MRNKRPARWAKALTARLGFCTNTETAMLLQALTGNDKHADERRKAHYMRMRCKNKQTNKQMRNMQMRGGRRINIAYKRFQLLCDGDDKIEDDKGKEN